MRLQPAYETTLCHGNHAVTLRASLRAAVALDNLPGGIPSAWDGVLRQSYTAIGAVIRATATDQARALTLLASLSNKPLAPFLDQAQAACLDLLAALSPERDDAPMTTTPAKPSSVNDYLADLFKFGTGWLGWPPSEVWNASPAEIEVAFLAHIDRLVKTTPGATRDDGSHAPAMTEEQRQENVAAGLDPEFNRAALHALKARHGG